MNIFDIFRSQNPNATQKPSQGLDPMNPDNPANKPPVQQTQQTTQQQPDPQTTPAQKQEPESPVDLSKLWTNDPNIKGPADPAEFKFTTDQNKINETFGKLDFTQAVSPELLAKIQAGGPEAISATLAMMNVIGQQAAKTAVLAATKVTESGIQQTGQRMKDFIPSVIRENAVSSVLREDNPLMKDPMYAPMVSAVSLQMSQQFPNATPEDIKLYTRKYFDKMVSDVASSGGKQLVDTKAFAKAAGIGPQTDFSVWDAQS